MDLQTVFVAVDEELNSYHVHHLRTRKKIRGKRKKRGGKKGKRKKRTQFLSCSAPENKEKNRGEKKK